MRSRHRRPGGGRRAPGPQPRPNPPLTTAGWRLAGGATAFGLLVAAFSPPGTAPPPLPVVVALPSPSPTPTPTPTESPTPIGPPSPLTGLPTDPDLLDRRVVAVKIDNHADARPQAGLNVADAVIELPVESGLTRFIALFHSTDFDRVGPVRSARPTDPTLVRPLDATLLVSGGQRWILNVIRDAGVPLFVDVGDGVTFRVNDRAAPNDLYADTAALRAAADQREIGDLPPRPWLLRTSQAASLGGAPVHDVQIPFSDETTVDWRLRDGRWVRNHNGAVHQTVTVAASLEQVQVDHLIVLSAAVWTARNPVDGGGVPALTTTGTGSAWVVVSGDQPRVIEATWSRTAIEDLVVLRGADGEEVAVPPGRVWVSWLPDTRSPRFDVAR